MLLRIIFQYESQTPITVTSEVICVVEQPNFTIFTLEPPSGYITSSGEPDDALTMTGKLLLEVSHDPLKYWLSVDAHGVGDVESSNTEFKVIAVEHVQDFPGQHLFSVCRAGQEPVRRCS